MNSRKRKHKEATEPSLAAQEWAEIVLIEMLRVLLAQKFERCSAEMLDAATVYAAPPWLSDVAQALGMTTPDDGAPLALNWNQALAAIRDLREKSERVDRALRRWRAECPCACAACQTVEGACLP
jgi:hypothetical protein